MRNRTGPLLCMALAAPLAGCVPGDDHEIAQMVAAVRPDRARHTVETLVGFGTRNTLSDTEHATRGIGAARRWILSEFERIRAETGGRLVVETDRFTYGPDGNRILRPTDIMNVVATLPGRQPASADRIYVISGHYDSMGSDPKDGACDAPGADDDASGVAVVLEAARALAGHEFDATIVFMAVAGEEQGLVGSRHWAQQARAAKRDIAGMFTNDIVGASRGPCGIDHSARVRVFSEGVPERESPAGARLRVTTGSENDSAARQLARYVADTTAAYVPGFSAKLVFRRDRYLRGGDHLPFLEAGYPAVRFTEYEENYDHQHQTPRTENGRELGDWPKFCDFDYVAAVARANVAALASLARAPAAPRHVRIITARLTNDTELRWDANTEPDLASYEVVWRDTTAARWEEVRAVGNVTHALLPLSKDNVIFGLRAVDQSRHRSVVTAALPARE